MTGVKALVVVALDFVSGLHMELPKIIRRAGSLARSFCSEKRGHTKIGPGAAQLPAESGELRFTLCFGCQRDLMHYSPAPDCPAATN
jgi:hypothetical protein